MQVEQARLHRDVEPAGRLVHEHQARRGDEIARDLQPLPHAAGKGRGRVVDAVGGDLDPLQPLSARRADAAVVAFADRHQPLADIGAGGDVHAQASRGILMHKAPVGAHQRAPLGFAERREIAQRAVAHAVDARARARRRAAPASRCSSVVLPEPDSPTIASTSPA